MISTYTQLNISTNDGMMVFWVDMCLGLSEPYQFLGGQKRGIAEQHVNGKKDLS